MVVLTLHGFVSCSASTCATPCSTRSLTFVRSLAATILSLSRSAGEMCSDVTILTFAGVAGASGEGGGGGGALLASAAVRLGFFIGSTPSPARATVRAFLLQPCRQAPPHLPSGRPPGRARR